MAAKGNMKAIEMVFDRVEGKPELQIKTSMQDGQGNVIDERYVILADGTQLQLPL